MKRLWCLILLLLALVVSACGGPTPKEEVLNLHKKYYKTTQDVFAAMAHNKYKDWSVELRDDMQKRHVLLLDNYKQLEKEKISKESEPYRNALQSYIHNYNKMFELGLKQLNAGLQNKPLSKSETKELAKQFVFMMDNVSQLDYEVLNEFSKCTNGKPVPVLGVNGKNYVAFEASNVEIVVLKAKESKKIASGTYFEKSALGKYIIIDLFIKNNQKDAITVDSNSFKLIDNDKREFSTSPEGETAYQMHKGTTKGFLTRMNPGMGTSFTFVFDVPDNMIIRDFRLEATGGFTGSKVILPIETIVVKNIKN